ncbi:MAG: stage II sporulation protein E (SpoIIE) [Gammaproteobacteria bacterium]|nr:MAG: stage II sporulation protein E (SpoIIE) [Gammaproteobacteria bacterium]
MGILMTNLLSYAASTAPMTGETENGDQYLVKQSPHSVLIAIADGLGHGEEASIAAKKAMQVLNDTHGESLIDLVHLCHTALEATRGSVLMLAHTQADCSVVWLGIGNILGIHWSSKDQGKSTLLASQGGVVGFQLPHLRTGQFTAEPGDTLIFATDGIFEQFIEYQPNPHSSPQVIANHIFKTYRNTNDDALVLVLRWMTTYDG